MVEKVLKEKLANESKRTWKNIIENFLTIFRSIESFFFFIFYDNSNFLAFFFETSEVSIIYK